jgi:L-asparagine oxygenase
VDEEIRIIKNVELGEVPPTPSTTVIQDLETPKATESLLAYGKRFGTPISYEQEQNGRLIQNIIPVHKTEYGQISTSSKDNLYLHTETAFHPYRPSFVLLLCMRGDSQAKTTIATISSIVPKLSNEAMEILQLPLFATGVDDSFMSKVKTKFELITPVLRQTDKATNQWEMVFDWTLMHGLNQDAEGALEEFKIAVFDSVTEISLETGDLLVIDNRKAIHGRSKFQPRYDGTDRWLKRLLVIKTMPPAQHLSGNMITTQFAS